MKMIYVIGIIALLTVIMVITPAAAKTWTVCSAGCDYTEIYDATGYDWLSDGDTIYVYSGTYRWFSIERSDGIGNITVKGEGADVVTIDCDGTKEIRIGDSFDANGTVLDGFKIINSPTGVMVGCFGSQAQNCIIRNCVFDGMTDDALRLRAANTTFENNVVSNCTGNYYALAIQGDGGTIVNNSFINNTGAAISLDGSTCVNTIVTKNNLTSNTYAGIELYDAGSGNKISLNNFIDNGKTATTSSKPAPAVTCWNSTELIEYAYGGSIYTNYLGNYWSSDYTGTDANGDGIGDTSYTVPDSLGEDYRPLMAGFENYPAPAAGICGDVNKDSAVNVLDATKVKNRAGNPLYPLDDEWAADVNCDKFINVLDATKVKNRAGNPGYPLNCCT